MNQTDTTPDWDERFKAMRRNRGEPARQIDEERFDYLLGVLPPAKWTHWKGFECFRVDECQTADLFTWCARITENGHNLYWEMIAPADSTVNEIHLKISIARWGSGSI